MGDFLKLFWASVVSIGGVIALYIALEEVDFLWVFWVVVGVGLLVAGIRYVGPRVVDDIVKLRNYPPLLERAAKMQTEIQALKAGEGQARQEAKNSQLDGIIEGRAQVLGAILASKVQPPRLVGIDELDGNVALVGEPGDELVPIGARFVVRVTHTGKLRGVVEVRQHDGAFIYMSCVDPVVPKFWAMLAERVSVNAAPPQDIELAPYDGSPITSMGLIENIERIELPEAPND